MLLFFRKEGLPSLLPAQRGSTILRPRFLIAGILGLFCFAGLVALGNWQVARRAWKLELIERIATRVHARPMPPPAPSTWPSVTSAQDEYLHVQVQGRFLHRQQTRVQALTVLGAGFWLLTPLRTAQGFVVLVNRGFVPPDWRGDAGGADDVVKVTGLLRMTEPNGGFLQTNDPAHHLWYSRDVAAIARAYGMTVVAPYFIDADATPNPGGFPVGGLTVIDFPNNHIVYAITWYVLALMVAGGLAYLGRVEWRRRLQPE